MAQVRTHQRFGLVGIARTQCGDDGVVLIVAAVAETGVAVHGNDDGTAGDQVFDDAQRDGVIGHLGQGGMELAGQPDGLTPVAGLMRGGFFFQVDFQRFDTGTFNALRRQTGQRRLDQQAGFKDFARLLRRRLGHIGAAVGLQLHHLAAGQNQQAAADPHTPHAEGLTQRRLGQLGPGRQALVHDGFVNAFDDARFLCIIRTDHRHHGKHAPR